MKKTTLLNNLLKSPPISVKTFKNTQKQQLTLNGVQQTYKNQQALKIRIEKIHQSLNQEIKQRQFEFKELYKMVNDLQKSKKFKCKHSVVVMERNHSPQQMKHIPFTVLQNNLDQKIADQVSELSLREKSSCSNNNFSQMSILKNQNTETNLMRKEKRKSKLGTIKSHKYLPTIYSSSQSIQRQNLEQNEEDKKSNLQTTTSQFFSNSHSHFNLNFQQREIVSPTKSIVSNSNIQKEKKTEEMELRITYFENMLKSLEASHNFLKEKVDTNFLKKPDITQQLKFIDSNIENQLSSEQFITRAFKQIKQKIKQVIQDLDQKYNKISEETSNNCKNIQSLIYVHQKQKNDHRQEITDIFNKIKQLSNEQNEFTCLKALQHQIECEFKQSHEVNQRYNSYTITRIEALESTQQEFLKEFRDLAWLKDQNLKSSKIKQSVSENRSFADPSFYSDKISQMESRFESTEEIVSELMKVSLTLTQKINDLTNNQDQDSNKMKTHKKVCQKKKKNKLELSEGYWSLKQELDKIDQQVIESSKQLIDESFLQNEENKNNSEAIKISGRQNKERDSLQQ